MTSELHIGQRVRTPYGDGVITSGHVVDGLRRVQDSATGFESWWDAADLEPLQPDVPRQAVEDLLAAVEKRVERLASEKQAAAAAHFTSLWPDLNGRHKELAHIAAALRKLLRGES